MGERHVGLDIGSFGVRAAEVSLDAGVPVLHRFAQVTLPPRAVVEGEILEREAVATAIRDLWAKGGFKVKKVVLGISNRDVKVRQAEVPDLSPEEVRSALRFETQDVIPFADDDSVVDFLVQSRFNRDGADMLKVLVVATPRARIDEAIAVVADAGLTVESVDLTPFALTRALASSSDPDEGEVIVSVGAGLTSVVVHSGGIPQMVRTTPGGGSAITEMLSENLSVRYEEAEAIKRTGTAQIADGGKVAALIETQLDALVREIAGSVDYFVAQAGEVDVRRVVMTGAGSLVPGLRERIATESHLPVLPADALTHVGLGKTRLTPEQLVAASTTLAGPVGLALAPLADPTTRLTALLPQSYIEGVRTKREARIMIAAVILLALILGGLYVKRIFTASAAQSAIGHPVHRRNAVQAREAQFAGLAEKEVAIMHQSGVLKSVLAADADASAILDQIAANLPPDVWLQSVSVVLTAGKPGGTATISATGTDPTSPAHWLSSMRGLTNTFSTVWVGSVSRTTVNGKDVVTFNSQATLAPGVVSHRADGYGVPK